jgi:uncharacterized membrane protein
MDQRPQRVPGVIFGVATDVGGTAVAYVKSTFDTGVSHAHPGVRRITPADLKDALAKGLDDFMAMPTFSVFLVLIYPIVGLVLLRLSFGYDMLPLVFPLMAGFALIGPLAGVGLYELSRRREQGLDVSWDALNDFHWPCIRAILVLGLALVMVFLAWLGAASLIYRMTFGDWVPPSVGEFARQIFTTQSGWTLIMAGWGVGFCFAVVAFAISVVSFPLLLDRDVGVVTAVLTSVRAVLANPVTMALWGVIVAAALGMGSLPFFFGLAVVLPVLGHATWHLYRKVVER